MEEKYLLEGISSILDAFTNQLKNAEQYQVIIAPQETELVSALTAWLPKAEMHSLRSKVHLTQEIS